MSDDDTTRGPGDDEVIGPFPHQPQPTGIEPDPAFADYISVPAPQEPDPPSDWIAQADPHDLPTRESKLVALGRFAFPPEPPLDDGGEAARDRRWTTRAVATTTLFLLTFNGVSLENWSRQQEPGWITDTVGQLSEVWTRQLSLLGVDQPRQGVREAWDAARDQRFVGAAEDDRGL